MIILSKKVDRNLNNFGKQIILNWNNKLEFENSSMKLYYCMKPDNSIAETCYESIDNTSISTISEEDEHFSVDDGACCEDSKSADLDWA